jgi:hypothetical protein
LNKNVSEKANELNELSKDFTLSHAVLATAKMIEDGKNLSISKGYDENADKDLLINYRKQKGNLSQLNNQDKEYLKRRIERENEIELEKVYVSVGNLSADSVTEGARTYCYKRKMLSEFDDGKLSWSEHFEIILPSKTNNIPVLSYKNKKLSKESIRFLVGHELGHLWLHLDEVRKLINNFKGTNLLPQELETEANNFSFELSDLRDKHIVDRARFIARNKP